MLLLFSCLLCSSSTRLKAIKFQLKLRHQSGWYKPEEDVVMAIIERINLLYLSTKEFPRLVSRLSNKRMSCFLQSQYSKHYKSIVEASIKLSLNHLRFRFRRIYLQLIWTSFVGNKSRYVILIIKTIPPDIRLRLVVNINSQ